MEYERTVEVACSFILHYLLGVIEFFLDGIEFGLAFSCSEPHFFETDGFVIDDPLHDAVVAACNLV